MAKRTLAQMADLIEDMVDKDPADTTFNTFVENMLVVTLQEIISHAPHARWLMEEHSITLTADQQYVTMPSDLDLEGIVSLRDDTNNRKVIRVDPLDADRVDPGRDLSGDVLLWWYQRVGGADRLYFIPQPDATDSLTLISGEIITDPTSAQSTALPAKYEWVWIAGTMPKVWERMDPSHNTTKWERAFERGLAQIDKDTKSTPGESVVMASHRPRVGIGITGPSFPTNFDILP